MARLLLVDDEMPILIVLQALLRSEGYETVIADSEKALKLLQTEEFDLLMTDVRMAPIDGLELLKRAKKAKPWLPVVMVTAFYSSATVAHAKKLGAYEFLKKPFDSPELVKVVSAAVAEGKKAREAFRAKK